MKITLLSLLTTLLISFYDVFAQVPSYVPSDGLVGYWGFNNNTNDESGNANHGTPQNITLTTDRFSNPNSAYQFNGSNSRIDIDNSIFNVAWNAFTISCWTYSTSFLNPNNYNDSQVVFNTSPHNGIAITMYGSNNPFYNNWDNKYVFLAGAMPNQRSWDIVFLNGNSNSNRTINTWNHLVLVKEGNNYRFYINGVLDKSVTGSTIANSYLCKIVIGGLSADIPAEVFLGKLDDYGIWNRALTQTEITNLYNSSSCLSQISLTSPSDDYLEGSYLKRASAQNGKIVATNKVGGTAQLILNAKSIELNSGFMANSGTKFIAEIGGCN
ncbi:hypothetical protein GCM10011514_44950 [Emticicia aquatilis]|uniref:LamG domain-containing protein n=1 Tax=Emticicia aquatilis TaxID=1537369 RepID=A0A916Z4M8_9BACT|nr:LamG domain-containing protein [Emticicia aquatilis]GGD76026.1 hypothetical protein GCM10011514_44950 [Emticicia aquatilis]